MSRGLSIDDLWNSAPPSDTVFVPGNISRLPGAARQYLEHAITPGTPLSWAVKLRMRGEIKLGRWYPFKAEEVISWTEGMIWQASVRMHGLAITGADSFLDGKGAMRWKLFRLIPIVNASGYDIARSAAGRVNLETIWLPAALSQIQVRWTQTGPFHAHASFGAHGEAAEIDYMVANNGRLMTVSMLRWGNPDGGEFNYYNCGALVEEERRFGGYTVPSRLRVGWHFGTSRFESEGEFFRVTIDDAIYKQGL